MDQENYTTGTLLEDSEQNVAEGYKENNELKKQLTDIFKDNLEVRKRCVFCFCVMMVGYLAHPLALISY